MKLKIFILILIIILYFSLKYIIQTKYIEHMTDSITTIEQDHYGYTLGQMQACSNPPNSRNIQEFKKVKYVNPFSYFCLESRDIFLVSNNYPEMVEKFVKKLPNVQHSFKVVICHGDYSISKLWKHIEKIIQHKYLLNIYAVNVDIQHPKIHPIPIGIDLHTPFFRHNNHPLEQEKELVDTKNQLLPMEKRPVSVYCNSHLNLTDMQPHHNFPGQRQRTYELFKDTPYFFFEQSIIPREQVWKRHEQHLFILSPPGNGLDCHRTWEAIILGGIPIILSTPLDKLYQDLPVVIVKQWEEITLDNLYQWRTRILSRSFNLKKLERQYWESFILNHS
jgi:hypothetical protein